MSLSICTTVACDRAGCKETKVFHAQTWDNHSYCTIETYAFDGFTKTKHGWMCDTCYQEWRKASAERSQARHDAFLAGKREPDWLSLEVWIKQVKP
jgi:hypothetical protein